MKKILLFTALLGLSPLAFCADHNDQSSTPGNPAVSQSNLNLEAYLLAWLKGKEQAALDILSNDQIIQAEANVAGAITPDILKRMNHNSTNKSLLDFQIKRNMPSPCTHFDPMRDNPEKWLADRFDFQKIQLAENIGVPESAIVQYEQDHTACSIM